MERKESAKLIELADIFIQLPPSLREKLLAYGNGLAAGCRLESESMDDKTEIEFDSHSPLAS